MNAIGEVHADVRHQGFQIRGLFAASSIGDADAVSARAWPPHDRPVAKIRSLLALGNDELLAGGHDLRLLVRQPQQRDLPWGKLVEVAEGDVLDLLSLQRALEGVDRVVQAR